MRVLKIWDRNGPYRAKTIPRHSAAGWTGVESVPRRSRSPQPAGLTARVGEGGGLAVVSAVLITGPCGWSGGAERDAEMRIAAGLAAFPGLPGLGACLAGAAGAAGALPGLVGIVGGHGLDDQRVQHDCSYRVVVSSRKLRPPDGGRTHRGPADEFRPACQS